MVWLMLSGWCKRHRLDVLRCGQRTKACRLVLAPFNLLSQQRCLAVSSQHNTHGCSGNQRCIHSLNSKVLNGKTVKAATVTLAAYFQRASNWARCRGEWLSAELEMLTLAYWIAFTLGYIWFRFLPSGLVPSGSLRRLLGSFFQWWNQGARSTGWSLSTD